MKDYDVYDLEQFEPYINLAGKCINHMYTRYFAALIHKELGDSQFRLGKSSNVLITDSELKRGEAYFKSDTFANYALGTISGEDLMNTAKKHAQVCVEAINRLKRYGKSEAEVFLNIARKEFKGYE